MSSSSSGAGASCSGFCRTCQIQHSLPVGTARVHARAVMQEFQEIRRLDYLSPDSSANPAYSFDRLFPGERGHMFGILECRDEQDRTVVLRAFSSLHEGVRFIEGWVPPILSAQTYHDVVLPGQATIKELSRQMLSVDSASGQYKKLFEERRSVSRELMEEIQSLYSFCNFRGERRGLRDAWLLSGSIPGGVGECCAPKLLNHAARRGLIPVGLAEFYWGEATPSGGRQSGEFYSCCEARCQPILGFLLCGAQRDD